MYKERLGLRINLQEAKSRGSVGMDQVSDMVDPMGYDEYTVTLGDKMRGERATLGKSLEDIYSEIRLRVDILEAIENADLAAFSSPSFVAGYVRSYATHLGLDGDECFQQFCRETGFVGMKSEIDGTKKKQKKRPFGISAKSAQILNDPILTPRIPNKPIKSGFLGGVSPSGVLSLMVLIALIGGLAYGGLAVLKEVQRVQFAPVNKTPSVIQSVSTFGQSATIETNGAPQVVASISNSDLEEFYRPAELAVPVMTPRDGPISGIDPSSFGVFAKVEKPLQISPIETIQPQVTETGPPSVDVVALKPAWVRVFTPTGEVLFEKILDSGQRYRLPENASNALMRAGNSGSVYVMVGDKMYGPVGKATGIARKVALDATIVAQTYAVVDAGLDAPLAEPININLTAQAVQ
jgi:cytoskeletal protein RodZ